jgi:hypothetical protein
VSRLEALEIIDWSPERKEKVKKTMHLEYMSSEESAEEEEEGGARRALFKVKELPWERKELRETKRTLDVNYLSTLSKRALYKRFKRVRGVSDSERPRPIDALRWAVRGKDKLHSPANK